MGPVVVEDDSHEHVVVGFSIPNEPFNGINCFIEDSGAWTIEQGMPSGTGPEGAVLVYLCVLGVVLPGSWVGGTGRALTPITVHSGFLGH